MYNPIPQDAARVEGVKLSPWTKDTDSDHCTMRFIEGTDPTQLENRVAFIEKTPRVRIRPFDNNSADWKNWHGGWKGDDGWDEVAQGWCDTHLVAMGYIVPDAKPYDDSML